MRVGNPKSSRCTVESSGRVKKRDEEVKGLGWSSCCSCQISWAEGGIDLLLADRKTVAPPCLERIDRSQWKVCLKELEIGRLLEAEASNAPKEGSRSKQSHDELSLAASGGRVAVDQLSFISSPARCTSEWVHCLLGGATQWWMQNEADPWPCFRPAAAGPGRESEYYLVVGGCSEGEHRSVVACPTRLCKPENRFLNAGSPPSQSVQRVAAPACALLRPTTAGHLRAKSAHKAQDDRRL